MLTVEDMVALDNVVVDELVVHVRAVAAAAGAA
jgi:hypothetical protein